MNLDPHGGNVYVYEGVRLDFSVNLNPWACRKRCFRLSETMARSMTGTRTPTAGPCAGPWRPGRRRRRTGWSLATGRRTSLCGWPWSAAPAGAGSCPHLFGIRGCGGSGGEDPPVFPGRGQGLPGDGGLCRAVQPGDDLVFLCNPQQSHRVPGRAWGGGGAAGGLQPWGAVLVVDECFLPFTDAPSCKGLLARYPNLIVLRAFTKLYAMAGLRLGYLLCSNGDLAGSIAAWGQCWSVSTPAQTAGWRRWVCPIGRSGPGSTFARSAPGWRTDSGRWAFRCTLPDSTFLMFRGEDAVGPGHGAGRDAAVLRQFPRSGRADFLPHRPQGAYAEQRPFWRFWRRQGGKSMAKAIMIQGTTSNAGKSFLAAALCRILPRTATGWLPLNPRIWPSTPTSQTRAWKWDGHR